MMSKPVDASKSGIPGQARDDGRTDFDWKLPHSPFVIPAKAGTQGWASRRTLWVPAFAGMTK